MSDTNELRAVKLTERRAEVLRHIALHSEGDRYGVRVPDYWIGEANASIDEGQTIATTRGRFLTPAGRAALLAKENDHA